MVAPRPVERLNIELERLALRALKAEYHHLNAALFEEALAEPSLRFVESKSRLGRWIGTERALEIARTLLTDTGWGVVVEVLKHEMAHQYVDEVLDAREDGPHGLAFRKVCQARGIDARASGVPSSVQSPSTAQARIVERIAKLLALAQSSNLHEAEVAMATAQRLMLKYNVDVAAQGPAEEYAFRHLGEPTGRTTESQRLLAVILRDHFFVEVLWVGVWRPVVGRRGSVLEVCGTPQNVEMAAYVHSFLTRTAEQLWRSFKRERGLKSNAAHQTYLEGVMSGFRDKLEVERGRLQRQGIVWAGDPEVTRYLRKRHPYIRTRRRATGRRSAEFHDGRKAGARIVLHRGVESRADGAPRLLGAARSAERSRP